MSTQPITSWTLAVLPVKNTVLLPHMFLPLSVGRPQSAGAVEAAMSHEEKTLAVVTQRDVKVDQPGSADLYTVGTRAIIKKMARTDNAIEVVVQGIERVEIVRYEQTEPSLRAWVQSMPVPEETGPEVEALYRAVLGQAQRVLELAQAESQVNIQQLAAQAGDPLRFVYLIGSMMGLDVAREQALLEAPSALASLTPAARFPQS